MAGFWRRLRFGLATLLGVKRLGFFIPYRYARERRAADYPALRPLFEAAQPRFSAVLERIESHADDLRAILPGGDPRASIRAGSRGSTRRRPTPSFAGRSRRASSRSAPAIRPASWPRPCRTGAFDPHHLHRSRRRGRPCASSTSSTGRRSCGMPIPAVFEALAPGDILFIDSSHIAMPGTDVDRLFLDVLPRLAGGTLVHIHDITLPDAYPKIWAWRGYNEQLLAGALLQGGGYELVFASHYLVSAGTSVPELPFLNQPRGILSGAPLVPARIETSILGAQAVIFVEIQAATSDGAAVLPRLRHGNAGFHVFV